jgi:pyridoxal 5'-phosphate synthase pdxS subunit
MSAVEMIIEIQKTVSIPVMAKVRIGHLVEAQILQELGVDFIDESEVLTPADDEHHILKHNFKSPFVCGCRNLGEALRRVGEGAAMMRTKGEAGSGNIVEAVRHLRTVNGDMRAVQAQRPEELMATAKDLGAPYELVQYVHEHGKLPVPNFAAGGIATPADAALCRTLGAEAVFVGSGIFKSDDPAKRAKAIVHACTHWDDPAEVLNASRGLGKAMEGIEMETLEEHERLANRGW